MKSGALLTGGLSLVVSPVVASERTVVGEVLALSISILGADKRLGDLLSSDWLRSEVPSSETRCRSAGSTCCTGVALLKRRPGMSMSRLFAACTHQSEATSCQHTASL